MDAIFKALNDPTRRALLDALREKDGQTLTELEGKMEMTRFGVMKHLKLLEEAHLIVARKTGRFKHHYLNVLPLQEVIDRWIDPLLQKPVARAALDLKSTLERTTAMSEKPDFIMETFIRTTQDRLWDALTDPENVIHYHFVKCRGEGAMSKEGDRMSYVGPDGGEMLAHTVRAIDPKSRIDVTFEPNWTGEAMTHSRCVYLIEPQGTFCKLTLEHYDLPADQPGISDGWARTISGLKTWLETGQDVQFATMEAAE